MDESKVSPAVEKLRAQEQYASSDDYNHFLYSTPMVKKSMYQRRRPWGVQEAAEERDELRQKYFKRVQVGGWVTNEQDAGRKD